MPPDPGDLLAMFVRRFGPLMEVLEHVWIAPTIAEDRLATASGASGVRPSLVISDYVERHAGWSEGPNEGANHRERRGHRGIGISPGVAERVAGLQCSLSVSSVLFVVAISQSYPGRRWRGCAAPLALGY